MGKLKTLIFHPLEFIHSAYLKVIYSRYLKCKKNIEVEGNIHLLGRPIVDVRNGGRIIFKNNVTLNSRNYGYHASMYGPVKLYADKPGALIKVGANTRINGACIHAYTEISIGANCLIAANSQILDSNAHEVSETNPKMRLNTRDEGKSIRIEDDVWIGLNCIIFGGVTIGRGSVIGAGSIVTRDIPELVVAAGNPAKIIKSFGELTTNQNE